MILRFSSRGRQQALPPVVLECESYVQYALVSNAYMLRRMGMHALRSIRYTHA